MHTMWVKIKHNFYVENYFNWTDIISVKLKICIVIKSTRVHGVDET